MHIHNSNNSIPEIHPAADELAMGICLYQQQKANKFHLESEQITYTASTSTRHQAAGRAYPWCWMLDTVMWAPGTLAARIVPTPQHQLQHTQQEEKCRAYTHSHTPHISYIYRMPGFRSRQNQAPVHKTLLLLPLSAVVGAGKSQLSSESISAL